MSIILKALKNSEQPQADEKKVVLPDNEDGFFHSGQSVVKRTSFFERFSGVLPNVPRRTLILAGVFVVICAFSLTIYISKREGRIDTVPQPADFPAAAQLPVMPVDQQPVQAVVQAQQPSATQSPAEAAYNSGNFDESLKLYKQELEKNKGDAKLHSNLGMVYLKKELYASAADEFKTSLELDSNCAECFNNFGYLKALLNQTDEAGKYFEKAMKISAAYPDPYFNMAVMYEKEGDIGNAVKYYQQFMSIYPDKNAPILNEVNKRIDFLKGK